MSVFERLKEHPEEVFTLFKDGSNEFNTITKQYLDPLAPKYSVLDEIYVDGLDASQVFGQSKMVLEGLGSSLLAESLPQVTQKYRVGASSSLQDDESESDGSEDSDGETLGAQAANAEDEEGSEDNDEEEEEEEQQEAESEEEEEDEEEEQSDSDFSGFVSAEENLDGVDNEEESEEERPTTKEEKPVKADAFGLNDGFFDIDEYNKQVLALEENDGDIVEDDDEEIDMFGDLSGSEDEEDDGMEYYDDFFDKKGNVKARTIDSLPANTESDEVDAEEAELDDGDYDNAVDNAMLDLFADEGAEEDIKAPEEKLSSFEKQQLALQKEIEKLEAELVADKKWTMKGEVTSQQRPQDSLLADPETAELEFDRTAKPVPVITEQVTETIEDLIRRRIRNKEFDDLPKRFITDVASFHNRQKMDVSQEKSSKSLAEIYEDQYKDVADDEEANAELKKQHDEISDLFASVSHKLDSLCSAHFIPKPNQFKQIEIKVSDNAAAISMEDSQPLHVSSDATLAPQEIYKIGDDRVKADGVLGRSEVQLKSGLSYSKEELSRDEKQRLHRAAKRKRTKDYNERESSKLQRDQQNAAESAKSGKERAPKRAKTSEVMDTLAKGNVTVIDKKGQLRDVKGNLKKDKERSGVSNLKM
ncbi:U3 small nucleolar RNA-associated protein Mpp10p [Diutina catenulata]